MYLNFTYRPRCLVLLILVVSLLAATVDASNAPAARADAPAFGYGVNPIDPGDPGIGAMDFDWTKVFGPRDDRLPYNVLRRIDIHADVLSNLDAWAAGLESSVRASKDSIEAWEIGNEPNLDSSFGWAAPPNAADYTRVLCRAYHSIKRAAPSAIVVSAALAPTGRVGVSWEGHKGYCAPGAGCSGYFQDEREFLREMLQAGAGDCLDALGYHPYGFAAPYDAAPSEIDPSSACGPNDFCFRGVEKIHDIMTHEFNLDKPIWGTEFGWVVDPRVIGRAGCWNDPSMQGFQWMVVTPQQQADNLVGAFEWARTHYDWMGPLFVFNYGFNDGSCNQMNFFDVKGQPAEAALRAMQKPSPTVAVSDTLGILVPAGSLPVYRPLSLGRLCQSPQVWSASVVSAPFGLSLDRPSDSCSNPLDLTVDPGGLGLGTYTSTLQITATNAIASAPARLEDLKVVVRVVDALRQAYLPATLRSEP